MLQKRSPKSSFGPLLVPFYENDCEQGFEIPANDLITRDEQITNLCFVCRSV